MKNKSFLILSLFLYPLLVSGQSIIGFKDFDYVSKLRQKATVKVSVLDKDLSEISIGTGFYIGRKGKILTNFHVLREFINHSDYKIQIQTQSGVFLKEISFLKCSSSFNQDLCLLQGKPSKHYFPIARSNIGRGHQVNLIGHCGEADYNIKRGKVINYFTKKTNKFKLKSKDLNYQTALIQTSAEQCPGDSGGPFFSDRGELLGIASIVFTQNNSSKEFNIGLTNKEVLDFLKTKQASRKIATERIVEKLKSEVKLLKLLD